jgi:hypothetical protein
LELSRPWERIIFPADRLVPSSANELLLRSDLERRVVKQRMAVSGPMTAKKLDGSFGFARQDEQLALRFVDCSSPPTPDCDPAVDFAAILMHHADRPDFSRKHVRLVHGSISLKRCVFAKNSGRFTVPLLIVR